jgi:hypothetical protein
VVDGERERERELSPSWAFEPSLAFFTANILVSSVARSIKVATPLETFLVIDLKFNIYIVRTTQSQISNKDPRTRIYLFLSNSSTILTELCSLNFLVLLWWCTVSNHLLCYFLLVRSSSIQPLHNFGAPFLKNTLFVIRTSEEISNLKRELRSIKNLLNTVNSYLWSDSFLFASAGISVSSLFFSLSLSSRNAKYFCHLNINLWCND